MDFLLKILTPRKLGVAALVCWGLVLGVRRRQALMDYIPYRRPLAARPNRLGEEISASMEQNEKRRADVLYQTITAQLNLAGKAGFNVSLLQLKADEAMSLNKAATRRIAVKMLNEIGMEIPRKSEPVIAGGSVRDESERPRRPRPRRVRHRRPKS